MRRAALVCTCTFLLLSALVPAAGVAARPGGSVGAATAATSWAAAQITAVVDAGLLGADLDAFRPDDDLTAGELYETLVALGHAPVEPADPARPVTMRELDAKLVAALGLGPTAWRVRVALRDAGLQPTAYAGTETVARLLGLRINHPQTEEWLERGPNMPASRAEAAFSVARLLALPSWKLETVRGAADLFTVPALTDWQTSVLSRGIRLVGFPYVFAGSSERRQKLWSATGLVEAPGGFDCSGFVWRVFKTPPLPDAPELGDVLQGRTSYAMSGEVPASERIGFDALEPGDVLFFGSKGPASKPAQVGHMGVYVGNGWFVHSSGNGVTLQPLEGWYTTTFAWARRPIAEAGLG